MRVEKVSWTLGDDSESFPYSYMLHCDLWSKPAIHDKEPSFVFFPNKPITLLSKVR